MKVCGCPRCKEREMKHEMEAIADLNRAFMELMVCSFGVDEEKNVELRLERDGVAAPSIGDVEDSHGCPWVLRLIGWDTFLQTDSEAVEPEWDFPPFPDIFDQEAE